MIGCATQKPYDSIRLTIHESEVAQCEQRGAISVTTDTVGVSILPILGPGGEDSSVAGELPRMDPRAVESLQYLAAKKGGDTILLTSIQSSSAKGMAYRCR
jgi:hypothetical protein